MFERPTLRPTWRNARPVGLRRSRLDAFRVGAMLVVILGHSEMQLGSSRDEGIAVLQLLLNVVGRAAVPLFLLLAGEHLAPRIARARVPGAVWTYIRHIAGLYAIGCLFYWITDFAKFARSRGLGAGLAAFIARQGEDPIGLLLHGPRPHLWFLVVLMVVAAGAAVILARTRLRYFVFGTAVLYGIGLAIGPYRPQLDPAGHGWWLQLLLQAPLFFATGLVFGLERERRARTRAALGLIVAGLVIHGLETLWISQTYGTVPFQLAMLIGTVFYGSGVGMFALTPGTSRIERWIGRFSPYVPAVYLTHIFFIETLRPPRGAFPEALVRVAVPLLTVALSFGSAWLFARLRRRTGRRSAGEPAAA